MPAPLGWPRYMKPGTLAAYLDISESRVRELEAGGVIPKRNPVLGAFDSEAVLSAIVKAAAGEEPNAEEEARRRTLEKLQGAPRARRRARA